MPDKMPRSTIFIFGVLVLVKTDFIFITELRHCLEEAGVNLTCCRFNLPEEILSQNTAIVEECAGEDRMNCDFHTCFGEKTGLLFSNGTIDKTSTKEWMGRDLTRPGDFTAMLEEKCLVDDLSSYGPPHMCDMKKFINCIKLNSAMNCPEWDNTETCTTMRSQVEECRSAVN